MNLEMHRMNRSQNDMIARNAALEAECARLRAALKTEMEKHAAIQDTMIQQFNAFQAEEHAKIENMKQTIQQEREDAMKQMQAEAAAQRQAHTDELVVMKRNLDARYSELIDKKSQELHAAQKRFDEECKMRLMTEEKERSERQQEHLMQFLSKMEEANKFKVETMQQLDSAQKRFDEECKMRLMTEEKERAEREKEQHTQFLSRMEEANKIKIEAMKQLEYEKKQTAMIIVERDELIKLAEKQFEEYVNTYTAKLLKTISFSQVSRAVAANYAHTQLIHTLDFKDKRVLIYSHFSDKEQVESYNYLTLEIMDHWFDNIIILTNCPNKWTFDNPNYNKYHILSYNFKSDFRNYGVFIMQTDKRLIDASQLCLMNDSFVVVDVNAFQRCMKYLFESTTADFAGITSSHENTYHLQSYFIIFNRRAINSILEYFKMRGLPINHQASISDYELGITSYLINEGLVPFAMVSNMEMKFPLNTTYYKWSTVLQQTGIVKRQHFLKQYPARFAMTDFNIALVADKFSQNTHFIDFLKYHEIKID